MYEQTHVYGHTHTVNGYPHTHTLCIDTHACCVQAHAVYRHTGVRTHIHTMCTDTHTLCTDGWTHAVYGWTHTHHVWTHTHTVYGHTHTQAQTTPGAELRAREEILRERNTEVKVAQLRLTLCHPMDSTVLRILQARILEWVAFPFSKRSSQPRDRTQVSGFCQTLSEDGIGVRGQSLQMSPGSAW